MGLKQEYILSIDTPALGPFEWTVNIEVGLKQEYIYQGFPQKNEKASWYLASRFQRSVQFARGAQFVRCAQFAHGAQFAARTVWGVWGHAPP